MSQKELAPVLIVILIAAALAGGYFIYTNYSNNQTGLLPTTHSTPQTTLIPSQPPETIVGSFYNNYWNCLKKYSDNIRVNCPFKGAGALDQSLVIKLETAQGFDPILCAQDLPLSITVDKTYISNNTATTTIHEQYTKDNQVTVDLKIINNEWKITNITCHP